MEKKQSEILVVILCLIILSQIWFPINFFETHWTKQKVFVNELLWDIGQIIQLSENLQTAPTEETAEKLQFYLEQFIYHDTWRRDAMHFDWFKEGAAYRMDQEDLKLRVLYQRFYFPMLNSASDGALTEDEFTVLENLHEAFQECYNLLADENGKAKPQVRDEHYLAERLDRLTITLDLR